MRMSFRIALSALMSALLAGCASHPKSVYHVGDEDPPEFLTGPISVLLTNLDGFSARVKVTTARANGLMGDVLEREGRLIFQPDLGSKGKRAKAASGMFFVWDTAAHDGYVLNDPLQAYAPISTTYEATNIIIDTSAALEEDIAGQRCRRVTATVQSSDGSSARFFLWQDDDAKHFPLRIQSVSTIRPITVEFSNLRLELPPQDLFAPPDGFNKYASATALMNELIVRQTTLAAKTEHSLDFDSDQSTRLNNWRPATPQ